MATDAWRVALLCATVVLVYLNSLAGAFQFDDFNVIVLNPVVHSLEGWWPDLGIGIRPLLKLTYVLNWTLGPDAFGFHVFNIAIHVTNSILVFTLARLLINGYGQPIACHAPTAALIAALLFALHPAQTEAITYISGRSSALMATFYLGAMIAYIAGTLREQHVLSRVLSPLLFCLALATKESAISLPLALLAWEVVRQGPHAWQRVARRLSIHGIVLLAAAIGMLHHPVYGEHVVPQLDASAMYANLLTQIDAISYLVSRLIVVYPLNIDPALRLVTAWTPLLAAKAVLLLTLMALGILAVRRRPWVGFGALWFFVQLAPTNSLLPRLDLANDRQLYLAGIGVFVAAGVEIRLLCDRVAQPRRALWALLAMLFVVLGGLTSLRNRDYATEITLWEQTARGSPRKARVFNNLGYAYSAAGCFPQAEAAYREALRLQPDYAIARDNLATLMQRAKSEPTTGCKQSG